MQVFDEVSKRWKYSLKCIKIVTEVVNNLVIFGYTERSNSIVTINIFGCYFCTDLSIFKGSIIFSKRKGVYFYSEKMTSYEIAQETLIKGVGDFPYLMERKYEAVENFDKFNNRQVILDDSVEYKLSKYLNYTFGIEFETSQGYIPEDICYRDGLIPLRDGSISGPEYSTVVLKGNDGISLLKQQLDTLKEYTNFNKECSLHIHLGGFPLDPSKVFKLYRLCFRLESFIEDLVPKYTFETHKYKANGKDYCKYLLDCISFEELYEELVGKKFFGSFTQAHPKDIDRHHKWNVGMRYFWLNLINLLCYNVNKTVEFRFLRPTYNFKKILLWLYIFNALLKYAETDFPIDTATTTDILTAIYPEELSKELILGVNKLRVLAKTQNLNGDFWGADTSYEEVLFSNLNI